MGYRPPPFQISPYSMGRTVRVEKKTLPNPRPIFSVASFQGHGQEFPRRLWGAVQCCEAKIKVTHLHNKPGKAARRFKAAPFCFFKGVQQMQSLE